LLALYPKPHPIDLSACPRVFTGLKTIAISRLESFD
jgi:hypothetical protein